MKDSVFIRSKIWLILSRVDSSSKLIKCAWDCSARLITSAKAIVNSSNGTSIRGASIENSGNLALANAKLPEFSIEAPLIDVPLEELTIALAEVMRRAEQSQAHLINFEELSTRERMSQILERMKTESFIEFS